MRVLVFSASLLFVFLGTSCAPWKRSDVEGYSLSRIGPTGLPIYSFRGNGVALATIGDSDYQAFPSYYWKIDPTGVLRIYEYDGEPVARLHLLSAKGDTLRVWNEDGSPFESYRREKLE